MRKVLKKIRTNPKLPFRRHFLLFSLLSLTAVAQLSWWVIFQLHEGKRIQSIQHGLWEQQRQIAGSLMPAQGAQAAAWLSGTFPDLEISPQGDLAVRPAALQRLDELAAGRMRMFIAEGIFFGLLLLGGVLYMYRTLQEEIAVEHRQSVFLSATSHELKTPITAIRLYLDTLSAREFSAEKRGELLAHMGHDLDRLNDLIERLLLAQSVVNPQGRPALTLVDLSEETQLVMQEVLRRIDKKRFVVNVDLDYGVSALADGDRWQLIVKNLVDNAIKYSPNGGTIDVYLSTEQGAVKLSVADTGLGIRAEERERIFERFYRIGSEDTRKTKGTGLGLYLVREIAESFGGRVWAESAGLGQGSTFHVELPQHPRAAT